jgi:hypothetical protein
VLAFGCLFVLIPFSRAGEWQGSAAETSWKNVQYLGGALGVRGTWHNWDNKLVVSEKIIQLSLKRGPTIEIDPANVVALSYAGKRLFPDVKKKNAAEVAATVLTLGLFGLAADSRGPMSHYIAIEYLLPDGRSSAILVRAHKDNYQAILKALRSATRIKDPDSSAENPPDTKKP